MADQLWTVRGSNPVAWQIPMWGVQKGNFFEFVPAVPLLNNQKVALHEKMSERGFYAQGIYKLSPKFIRVVAREHPQGTQPEDMLVWGPRRQYAGRNRDNRRDRGEFIDALAMTGIGTAAECEFWLKSICNLMLDWLINQDKTVDLYFARLHPTHMSLDWFRRMRDETVGKHWLFCDRLFRSGSGLRIRPHRECGRRVELELTRIWGKLAEKVEHNRFLMLQRQGYADTIQPLLHSQEAFWKKQFAVYKAAVLAAPARFAPCRDPGRKVIVPSSRGNRGKPRGRNKRTPVDRLRRKIKQAQCLLGKRQKLIEQLREVCDIRRALIKSYRPGGLRKAHDILQRMRDLRSLVPELRNPGGLLDESTDGRTRALWLLVRLSRRKLDAEKLLVGKLNRRLRGMGKRLEQLPR